MRSRAVISATLPKNRGRRSKLQTAGRVCAQEHCFTILSQYNPSGFCSVHESARSAPDQAPRRTRVPEMWSVPTALG